MPLPACPSFVVYAHLNALCRLQVAGNPYAIVQLRQLAEAVLLDLQALERAPDAGPYRSAAAVFGEQLPASILGLEALLAEATARTGEDFQTKAAGWLQVLLA